MAASARYIGIKVMLGIIVLLLVLVSMSAIVSYGNYARRRVDVRNQIAADILANEDKVQNMSYEERQEFIDSKWEEYKKEQGIEKPLMVRSFERAFKIMKGDWGRSEYINSWDSENSDNIVHIIAVVLPRSLLLYVTSMAISVPLGIYVGTKAAVVESERLDHFIQMLSTIGASSPIWWLGMLAIAFFGVLLGWVPISGAFPSRAVGLDYYLGIMYRMILPVSVIVFVSLGSLAVIGRKMVGQELTSEHVIAARSKGIPEKKIVYGPALRTASPAIISRGFYSFLDSIPQLVILEIIYGWPGMGLLLYYALGKGGRYGRPEDPPIVVAIIFILTLVYVIGNIALEIAYGYLDPRVSVESREDNR